MPMFPKPRDPVPPARGTEPTAFLLVSGPYGQLREPLDRPPPLRPVVSVVRRAPVASGCLPARPSPQRAGSTPRPHRADAGVSPFVHVAGLHAGPGAEESRAAQARVAALVGAILVLLLAATLAAAGAAAVRVATAASPPEVIVSAPPPPAWDREEEADAPDDEDGDPVPPHVGRPRPRASAPAAAATRAPAEGIVRVRFTGDRIPSGVEVTCDGAYRRREPLSDGAATFTGVPSTAECKMHLRGVVATAATVRAGQAYGCSVLGTTTRCAPG